MSGNKKKSADFLAGLRTIEERDAVRRHPPAIPATPTSTTPNLPASLQIPQQPSRRGKVAITQWVDPAVRKQLARMAIDLDSSQSALVAEALNLLFEKYGQPPIAGYIQDETPVLQPAS